MKCLLIEDDKEIAGHIIESLVSICYDVKYVDDGSKGLQAALVDRYDIIVLDMMMPGMMGADLIQALRKNNISTPVLVVSALGATSDRVEGLSRGADDYLPKPFSTLELQIRVRNLVKRSSQAEEIEIRCQGLHLNRIRREVSREGKIIDLQDREYRMVELLMSHPDKIVNKQLILSHIWGYHFDPHTNIVDVLMCRVRAKLDKGFNQRMIYTVRGVGYTLRTSSRLSGVSSSEGRFTSSYF
ncbi:response regulator transcription factor [Bdellovibrio bacteriovorus]|uniref:response regulator transcription factor n=1 Tax=Bdellovibrio bacteriovorus TaxID=959 RepID=UPI0035A5ACA7